MHGTTVKKKKKRSVCLRSCNLCHVITGFCIFTVFHWTCPVSLGTHHLYSTTHTQACVCVYNYIVISYLINVICLKNLKLNTVVAIDVLRI